MFALIFIFKCAIFPGPACWGHRLPGLREALLGWWFYLIGRNNQQPQLAQAREQIGCLDSFKLSPRLTGRQCLGAKGHSKVSSPSIESAFLFLFLQVSNRTNTQNILIRGAVMLFISFRTQRTPGDSSFWH